jgi:hypothetical protein
MARVLRSQRQRSDGDVRGRAAVRCRSGRRCGAVGSLVTAALLGCTSLAWSAQRTYEVGADEMTRRVAERFPRQHCLLMIACVTLSDPVIELRAGDDRVHLRTAARPEVGGQALAPGEVAVAGTLRYEPAEGALYLDRAKVTEARFPDVPPARQRQMAELASTLLAEALRTTPIHTLDDSSAQQALAKLVLRAIRVKDGKLLLVVGDED